MPVLAVIGHKHSGKTTVIEGLVSKLVKRGFNVATSKHVSKNYIMDIEGKDTWRHSMVGANPVILVSDKDTILKIRNDVPLSFLDVLLDLAKKNNADVMVIEGFSSLVLKDKRVGKIICIRNMDEYNEYKKNSKGEILAYCSIKHIGNNILNTKNEIDIIVEKAISFIERDRNIRELLSNLGGLDCRKCGRINCLELAEAVYQGKASLDECVLLKAKPYAEVILKIREKEVLLQPFVAKIIQKTVLGIVSSLKGVDVRGDEHINISIT
ncbi:MAG: molybdopterin-guanine dinucleotide biosynthesis protein B [Candidatus Jordarchaeaceae archaeon]